jgi:hypothetical protein
MPKIKSVVAPGFHYTFLMGDTPRVIKPTEDLRAEHAYSLHYMVDETGYLFPISPEILPYN